MRGSGWEHVVASPNAERACALDTIAELSDLTASRINVIAGHTGAEAVLRGLQPHPDGSLTLAPTQLLQAT
ncbi:carbamate kinase [Kribbella aluminosa]|uniref:Carbamate kinase n=1 Tax=Kribbella aluminosa TaxID=416017 RepID=A0ABS4UN31_9ACTN|nr:hypothetical protein [Kribbella aluminosa]MBP2353009.1 carbamate kinase [Kribbella aluminosa]